MNIKRKYMIFITVTFISIYFIVRLFIDLPPKMNVSIDHYIDSEIKISKEKQQRLISRFPNLGIFESICVQKYLSALDDKKFKYCQDNNLGRNVVSGCYHVREVI